MEILKGNCENERQETMANRLAPSQSDNREAQPGCRMKKLCGVMVRVTARLSVKTELAPVAATDSGIVFPYSKNSTPQ